MKVILIQKLLNESDDDQINNINIEKEEYKKTLNKFSKDVYHFLNLE